jgi:hypothetical protein
MMERLQKEKPSIAGRLSALPGKSDRRDFSRIALDKSANACYARHMEEGAKEFGVTLPCGGSLTEAQLDAMDESGPSMICTKGCWHDYMEVGLSLSASQGGAADLPDSSEITLSRGGKFVLAILVIFAMGVFVKYWMMFKQ